MGGLHYHRLRVILGVCAAIGAGILLENGAHASGWPEAAPASTISVASEPANRTLGAPRQPHRRLQRRLNRLRPGETLVLRPGTYGARGTSTYFMRSGTRKRPITIRGMAHRRPPRLLGAMRIRGSHLSIRRVVFDGPTGPAQPRTAGNPGGEQVQVGIGGASRPVRDVTITQSVVRDSDWHAGIYVSRARHIRIVRNHIHGNGDAGDPEQANQSHGIYWGSGSGLIANNLINNNLARGVQLYPRAARVRVAHNTIVSNGRAGVQLGGSASHNVIVNNLLAFNGDQAIRTYGLTGTDNLARANLEWASPGNRAESSPGLRIRHTIEAKPRFAGGAYRLRRKSRAIDAGVRLGSVSVDYNGRHRPLGRASDLGAYESG